MKEVAKDEFYTRLMAETRNVISSIQPGPYPYTTDFKYPATGGLFGRIVGYRKDGVYYPTFEKYYLST